MTIVVCNYHLAFAQRLVWGRVSWGGLGSCWWGDRWTGLTFPPPSSPSRGHLPPSAPPSTDSSPSPSPTWFPPSDTPSSPSHASLPELPLSASYLFCLSSQKRKGILKKSWNYFLDKKETQLLTLVAPAWQWEFPEGRKCKKSVLVDTPDLNRLLLTGWLSPCF